MEFLDAADQIHVLNGQGILRTCKTLADFTELSASIPGMALIDRSDDEPQHPDDTSHPSSSADHPFQPKPGVLEATLDSDIADLDCDSRKSGDLQSYSFLFYVIPISASVVYLVLMVLALVLEKFLGSSSPHSNYLSLFMLSLYSVVWQPVTNLFRNLHANLDGHGATGQDIFPWFTCSLGCLLHSSHRLVLVSHNIFYWP